MRPTPAASAFGCAVLTLLFATCAHAPAFAHGIAGDRVFPVTLTIDDPAVADEASFPTFTWQHRGTTDDGPAGNDYGVSGEFDKRITKDLGVAINEGFNISENEGQKNNQGFTNLATTLKYHFYTNAPHEFMASFGVIEEWGGTGALGAGAARTGTTTPTLYWGKGLGDLPENLDLVRPFALTGTLGYQIANQSSYKGALNADLLALGFSLQYSMPYLRAHVKDYGLPEFVNRLIPVAEFTYTAPTLNGGDATPIQGTIAPGLLYSADTYQLGLEAIVPVRGQPKTNVGIITQFHMFFDDLFPTTLGKPIFGGGE